MKNTNSLLKVALFIAAMILFSNLAAESRAATSTVDTAVDNVALMACTSAANDCSLRGAISKANSTVADDTIDFAIPANDSGCTSGGVCTITLLNDKLSVDITSTSGKLTITNSTGASKLLISGNNASRVFTIAANSGSTGDLTLNGLTVTNGRVSGVGGGISNHGRLALINSVVTGNTAVAGDGGGIYNSFVTTITNSTISNNSGGNGGGIFNDDEGANLTITNSTLSGNMATNNGGGIADVQTGVTGFSNGSFDIRNSTISGNAANNGGGIYSLKLYSFFGPKPTLLSVTITGNSSTAPDSNGGGISFINAFNFTLNEVNLRNSIIAGNNNVNSPDIYGILDANSDYNLIGNGTGLTNNAVSANANQIGTAANPINPLLDQLADNGSLTKTHALLTGSPAIDKGNSFGLTTDQRGLPRPVDFASIQNALGGNGADIGAFEAQTAPTAASVTISGRVSANGRGLANALVIMTDALGETRTARTDAFGIYYFTDVPAGASYGFSVASKRYSFSAQVISVFEEMTELNFTMKDTVKKIQ